MNTVQCIGCKFWNKTSECCDFFEQTGKLRPRDGEICLVDEKSRRGKVKPTIRPLLAELGEMRVSK